MHLNTKINLFFAILSFSHLACSVENLTMSTTDQRRTLGDVNSGTPSQHAGQINVDVTKTPYFVTDIAPILNRYCMACHGDNAAVSLSFKAIEDGNDVLWDQVVSSVEEDRMPPPGVLRFTDDVKENVITLFRNWQAAGFPYEDQHAKSAKGQTKLKELPLVYQGGEISAIMQRHCVSCHGSEINFGGMNLNEWSSYGSISDREKWSRVVFSVLDGTMPPSGPLPEEDIGKLQEWYEMGMPRYESDIGKSIAFNVNCAVDGVPESSIVRLSNTQLVDSLISYLDTPAFRNTMQSDLSVAIQMLPNDRDLGFGFGNAHQSIGERHVEGQFILARVLAERLARIERWVFVYPRCFVKGTKADESCFRTFLSSWGYRLFRRPLSNSELERYHSVYNSVEDPTEALESVWARMLFSPSFLYLLDDQGTIDQEDPTIVERSLYEQASYLAYALTGKGPDEALLAKAADGTLLNKEVFEDEFNRLIGFASKHLHDFTNQWLGIEQPLPYDMVSAAYRDDLEHKIYDSGGSPFDGDAILLRKMSEKIIATSGYKFADYFSVPMTFVDGLDWSKAPLSRLGQFLYGRNFVDDVQDLPERRGILTHVAPSLINQNQNYVNPIFRGIWFRETFLCKPPDDFPSDDFIPSDTAIPHRDMTNMNMSTREIVERVTGSPQCQSCHKFWNGVGFAMDELGVLGDFRENEKIYTDDLNAVRLNTLPINTSSTIILDGVTEIAVNGVMDLQAKVAVSPAANRCFAENLLVQHGLSRKPRASDSCMVDDAVTIMNQTNGGINEMLREILRSKYVRMKRVIE